MGGRRGGTWELLPFVQVFHKHTTAISINQKEKQYTMMSFLKKKITVFVCMLVEIPGKVYTKMCTVVVFEFQDHGGLHAS